MVAFSNENVHKDSTMFSDETVEHLTSWLTINPFKGCSLRCAYCFRAKWHPENKAQEITDVHKAVDDLLNHPNFIRDVTPISINNSSTDPLLPKVKTSTFKAVEILETKKLKNPFIIISKLRLTEKEIEILSNLENIKPIVFVSLAFIPKHIEPISISSRIKNLQLLSKTPINTVLYFRPIVSGWNDSLTTIRRALKLGQKYCNSICIGGLRMSPEIRKELLKAGEELSSFENDFHTKSFQDDIEKRILIEYKKMKLTVPLFKHSSCAVSNILKISNYNLLQKTAHKNCLVSCPSFQQILCKSVL